MRPRRVIATTLAAALCAQAGCKDRAADPAGEGEPDTPATGGSIEPTPDAPPPALPAASGEHTGTHTWSLALGGDAADALRAVAVGPQGEIVVTGYFSGTATFGGETLEAGLRDVLLAKLSPDGKLLWAKKLGGNGDDIGQSVAIAPDGDILLTGTFTGTADVGDGEVVSRGATDVFIGRYSPDGEHRWSKVVGGAVEDRAYGLAIAPGGDVVVTGYFGGVIRFGEIDLPSAGHADIFVARLSADGEHVWSRAYGSDKDDLGRAVAVDADGNAVVCGDFHGEVALGRGKVQSHGNADVLLMVMSPEGQPVWAKTFGAAFHDFCVGVAVDASGHIAFTGSFEEGIDFGGGQLEGKGKKEIFLARYSRDGQYLWARAFGSTDDDVGGGVALDAAGNAYLTGWYWEQLSIGDATLESAGKNDIALAKLAPNGEPLWAKSFGGADEDFGRAIALTPDGGAVVVGTFRHDVSLGGDVLSYTENPSVPTGDAFVARYAP